MAFTPFTKDERPTMENFNEKFRQIQNSPAAAVGDILTTIRTDVDDSWLLANGDKIDPELYPELHDLRPGVDIVGSTSAPKTISVTLPVSAANHGKIAYGDGKLVLVYPSGAHAESAMYRAISTDGGKTWTNYTPVTLGLGNIGNFMLTGFAYCDGAWVAAGYGSQTTSPGGTIVLRATDPANEWTVNRVSSYYSIGQSYTSDTLHYYDGKLVMIQNASTAPNGINQYGLVLVSEDKGLTWSTSTVFTNGGISNVVYANGKWVAGSLSYDYYATSENAETWTRDTARDKTTNFRLLDGIYHKPSGVYIFIGTSGGDAPSSLAVFTTTNLATPNWTAVRNVNVSAAATSTCKIIETIEGIVFITVLRRARSNLNYGTSSHEFYILSDVIANATSSDFKSVPTSVMNLDYYEGVASLVYHDGVLDYLVYYCASSSSTPYVKFGRTEGLEINKYLPVVTTDNAYCYIKAKEATSDGDNETDTTA